MKNSSSRLSRHFVILSLALVGLMVLQVMLLRYAWDWKQQSFVRGAQSALAATVVALESREIEGTAYNYFFSLRDSADTAVSEAGGGSRLPRVDRIRQLDHMTVARHLRRTHETSPPPLRQDSLAVVVSTTGEGFVDLQSPLLYHPSALRNAVGQWIVQSPQPIKERLDQAEIDTVLRAELGKVGIAASPLFGVVQAEGRTLFETRTGSGGHNMVIHQDSDGEPVVVMASDHVTDAELAASPYRHQLFPLDPFAAPYDLVLVFPRDELYVFWQIWPLWLASVLFIGVIVYSFARAWRTNSEQRRFADQLVDFINNMTHEFKTPISTVGLAGEAITRHDVQAEPEVFARYVGMIRDENRRMHRQVEKILQMARFERGDLELKRETIAVHEVLSGVVASFNLVVEQRAGTLKTDLAAENSQVSGDRVHLESIFGNLVDNAIKYSPARPQVQVVTSIDERYLVVKVVDRGLGIDRVNQKRVFDKYYRCPTGNRHDVKGYGLGLSFVKSLVAAHGGYVELHSLPGQGTTVTVSLPLVPLETEVTT